MDLTTPNKVLGSELCYSNRLCCLNVDQSKIRKSMVFLVGTSRKYSLRGI